MHDDDREERADEAVLAADGSVIALILTQDPQVQLGLPVGRSYERSLPTDPEVKRGEALHENPRVEARVSRRYLEVQVLGDNRPRRVAAVSLGGERHLAGEEDGFVEAWTRPLGDDSWVRFDLRHRLRGTTAVHVEWEQGIQIGSLGVDPEHFQEVVAPLLPVDFTEDEFYSGLINEKCCEEERPL